MGTATSKQASQRVVVAGWALSVAAAVALGYAGWIWMGMHMQLLPSTWRNAGKVFGIGLVYFAPTLAYGAGLWGVARKICAADAFERVIRLLAPVGGVMVGGVAIYMVHPNGMTGAEWGYVAVVSIVLLTLYIFPAMRGVAAMRKISQEVRIEDGEQERIKEENPPAEELEMLRFTLPHRNWLLGLVVGVTLLGGALLIAAAFLQLEAPARVGEEEQAGVGVPVVAFYVQILSAIFSWNMRRRLTVWQLLVCFFWTVLVGIFMPLLFFPPLVGVGMLAGGAIGLLYAAPSGIMLALQARVVKALGEQLEGDAAK